MLQNFQEYLPTEHIRKTAFFYRAPLGNCLFHAQVAGFQPQDTVRSISQVLFKYFIQEQEVVIRRRSLT